MRDLSVQENQVVSLLTQHSVLNGSTLGQLMGISSKEVCRIVSKLRKQFTRGNQNAFYVHLSKRGYTLEETPENLKYEGMRRLKMGTSVILNGKHVFMRYKGIALNDYHALRIAFQPKALRTINVLSDDAVGRRRRIPPTNNGRI